jgi:uncharacterized repeat protein (TIGR03803 family)
VVTHQHNPTFLRFKLPAQSNYFALLVLFALFLRPLAQAQQFSVIHSFTGGADGANPYAALTVDRAGKLYGTTFFGGDGPCNDEVGDLGCGVVFRLANSGSGWILTPLYSFQGNVNNDGAGPYAGVAISPSGKIFGTTAAGGEVMCSVQSTPGCGTVFSLTPPPSLCKTSTCPWTETVLFRFTFGTDGWYPQGTVALDSMGNLYGTTYYGGNSAQNGTVYQLIPSGNGWHENVLYSFAGDNDGGNPVAGLTLDTSGNLYGTTSSSGTIFQLAKTESGWTKNTLHTFTGESGGLNPFAGLIFDPAGNLYGAASGGGSGDSGTVFELSPSMGSWTFATLYGGFTGGMGAGPRGTLVMDSSGNLYGTTNESGANQFGSVFELSLSNGGWTYTDLHDFNGSDGKYPVGGLVIDRAGNLYGTTTAGGIDGYGVVFKIALAGDSNISSSTARMH